MRVVMREQRIVYGVVLWPDEEPKCEYEDLAEAQQVIALAGAGYLVYRVIQESEWMPCHGQ